MTVERAVVENRFKRVACKALKFEIRVGEEPGAFRSPACYRDENVELRVEVVPYLIDFGAVRVGLSQASREMTRAFRISSSVNS
ncbi:MAG: hypothetical protein J2P21_30640 [Chloracidobacterium sp.]|nr:hypothetical protein [Chloracidobacterium sp.]